MTTPGDQRARLAELLRQQALASKPAPLSFSQERMWFLDQWSPGSASFNMPVAVRLSGELDEGALRRSLEEIVRRHQVLRTTFTQDAEGRPLQVVAPAVEVPLHVVEVPEGEGAPQVWQRLVAEAQRPFDLASGPLFRFTLFRQSRQEHLLLVNMHHIATDAWSLGVFTREMAVLYQGLAGSRPATLSPLPIQYPEYAAWQREWLKGDALEEALAYWRARLDPEAFLELPVDRARPAARSPRGARQELMLAPELTQGLKDLGLKEGRTLFVVLLSAFKVLLSRYTGQVDVTVGTLVAGRPRAQLEELIGLFINALALRTSLSGEPTFRELMARVHETALGAFAHQDLPFERIVDALKPERHLGRLPIFQVMLILQNAPRSSLEAPGLVMEALPVDTGTTKHDVTLYAVEQPQGGMRLTAEYSTDLFEAETITRMLGHLQALLAGAVATPDVKVGLLPMLGGQGRQQLLSGWSGPAAEYPTDACLHHLIEAQAHRTPDAVAVSYEGAQLTYRQLDAQAEKLARRLSALGVGPEVRVGVCVERSLEMMVALLGTLKAGGAYVPMDASYPQERLRWMVEDAAPAVLLVQQRLESRLPPHQAKVVRLDGGWLEEAHPEQTPAKAEAGNLAYVIFTSGSTGRPKGAMNVHQAVCNRL
ncbi:MAG TPA: condensation domain-containing protein, partial [Myxococcales bacterium]|nr:condensation domain-containing protein [Myxococcales bacterium]